MKTALYTVALGAALLLTGAGTAGAQEGLFTSERDCTTDVSSLCAGVKPGDGHVLACLQAHVGDLSVGCSTILSKAASGPRSNAQGTFINSAPPPRSAAFATA